MLLHYHLIRVESQFLSGRTSQPHASFYWSYYNLGCGYFMTLLQRCWDHLTDSPSSQSGSEFPLSLFHMLLTMSHAHLIHSLWVFTCESIQYDVLFNTFPDQFVSESLMESHRGFQSQFASCPCDSRYVISVFWCSSNYLWFPANQICCAHECSNLTYGWLIGFPCVRILLPCAFLTHQPPSLQHKQVGTS